jgi:large conductance mechanosensitive channel
MFMKTKILDEFKNFAVKGNVIDLAVGVVVGAAFGKIVSSLVADIITPIISVLVGGIDFKWLELTLRAAVGDTPAVMLRYGLFLQTIFDFVIIAAAIFMFVKLLNRLRRHAEKQEEAKAIQNPPEDVLLLREIRDLLKK